MTKPPTPKNKQAKKPPVTKAIRFIDIVRNLFKGWRKDNGN
jgi:hypothetical protein